MNKWFVSELQEALATSTHDVQMVLNYLAKRGDLDMSRIGMFGQGSGGAIAILSAAADSRIVALDVLDPWGDWPD
jgi:acetyl esterase/lipase